MSNIDKRALREAAEKATESDWIVDAHEGWHAVIPVADAVNGNYIIAEFQGPESKRNRDFVAAANPAIVLALLDELEYYKSREERVTKLVLDNSASWEELYKKLEAAEKRVAELEAREVVLPSTQDVHPLGPQSAKIFCEFHRSIVNRCADEIRKVGVKVSIKGN
ncbi:ead/Ea22-like family protein [Enterobacter hormaechei]|uniref:ead/Ea22-like family protein n=1 Tax=Enterobacter hormaechei TaxID=158836 RepID=UPI0031E17CFD